MGYRRTHSPPTVQYFCFFFPCYAGIIFLQVFFCVYTLCTMNCLFLFEKLMWPFKLNLILVKSRKQVNTVIHSEWQHRFLVPKQTMTSTWPVMCEHFFPPKSYSTSITSLWGRGEESYTTWNRVFWNVGDGKIPVGPFVKAWWWQQHIPDVSGLGRDYCLPVEAAIRFL